MAAIIHGRDIYLSPPWGRQRPSYEDELPPLPPLPRSSPPTTAPSAVIGSSGDRIAPQSTAPIVEFPAPTVPTPPYAPAVELPVSTVLLLLLLLLLPADAKLTAGVTRPTQRFAACSTNAHSRLILGRFLDHLPTCMALVLVT